MTDTQPTIQEIYAQIKANPGAYADLMNTPDQYSFAERLVKICHDSGLKDMTVADMERFIDRDLGEILQDLNGDDGLSDEELELLSGGGFLQDIGLVQGGGGTQNNIGKR